MKSPEPAKHDAPTRIQAQPFSSHGNFRARNFHRLWVSEPPRHLQTRQIYPLVLHPFPPYRCRNWLGHVPLFTLIIGHRHDRCGRRHRFLLCCRLAGSYLPGTCGVPSGNRVTDLRQRKDRLRVRLAGNCSDRNNNHPPIEKAVKNTHPPQTSLTQ